MQLRIVFISNFFSPHLEPFSESLYSKTYSYCFISLEKAPDDLLGRREEEVPSYVLDYSNDKNTCEKKIDDADVIILGSVSGEMIHRCTCSDKIVFFYSERPLKNGTENIKFFPRWIKWHVQGRSKTNCFLLSAGAFAASDYHHYGLFKNRSYKWGYFPVFMNCEGKFECNEFREKVNILWCGRLLDWKHPESALWVAEKLKRDSMKFHLRLIGSGPMESKLKSIIAQHKLDECVELAGAMSPQAVRKSMMDADIFLFTSDKREGWGAVLNEAMNSADAVVASDAAGSVPYLIREGFNGLVYHSGDWEQLYDKVKYLLKAPEKRREIGREAYKTICTLWNAETASERFLQLISHIQSGEKTEIFSDGPCSKAEDITDQWYINQMDDKYHLS